MAYFRRAVLVDTLGLLIVVKVVAASVPERQGAKQLLEQLDRCQPTLLSSFLSHLFGTNFKLRKRPKKTDLKLKKEIGLPQNQRYPSSVTLRVF